MKITCVPDYSPSDLVRLELLAYPIPEGLHPVEHAWRDLAKKLLTHTKELQRTAIELNQLVNKYQQVEIRIIKFPEVFDPNYNVKPTTEV